MSVGCGTQDLHVGEAREVETSCGRNRNNGIIFVSIQRTAVVQPTLTGTCLATRAWLMTTLVGEREREEGIRRQVAVDDGRGRRIPRGLELCQYRKHDGSAICSEHGLRIA